MRAMHSFSGDRPRQGPLTDYLTAVFAPPLAVRAYGRRQELWVNVALTLLLWVPGALHAASVVHRHHAEKQRADLLVAAFRNHVRR